MKKITIATFNCENLFICFKFAQNILHEKIDNAVKNGFIKDKTPFQFILEAE